MRVTFVVANYPPSVGGAQLLVQRIAEGLSCDHGHRVHVVTSDALLSPGTADPGRVPADHLDLGTVSVERPPLARRTHRLLRMLRKVQVRLGARSLLGRTELLAAGPMGLGFVRAVRRAARGSDVVIGVSSSFLTMPIVAAATRSTGAAVVHLPLLHVESSTPRPSVLRALRTADRCVALTQFESEWLVENGVPSDRATVVPAGCERATGALRTPSEARAVLGLADRPTIAYVGRMAAHKGIDTLVAAMANVWQRCPDVTLLLAGNRAGWSEFERVAELGRTVGGDRLVLREGFAEGDKQLLYQAADVVAFPSREESFGIVTIEAWSVGRPVVCGDIGAVRSLVRDGVDAELVPVDDTQAWADALLALLEDPERRTSMGAAGLERVEQEFAWPVVVDRWNDELARVARSRPAAMSGGR